MSLTEQKQEVKIVEREKRKLIHDSEKEKGELELIHGQQKKKLCQTIDNLEQDVSIFLKRYYVVLPPGFILYHVIIARLRMLTPTYAEYPYSCH